MKEIKHFLLVPTSENMEYDLYSDIPRNAKILHFGYTLGNQLVLTAECPLKVSPGYQKLWVKTLKSEEIFGPEEQSQNSFEFPDSARYVGTAIDKTGALLSHLFVTEIK